MEDSQIVALYWDRDEAAIDHTQKKYGKYLTKIAYNILSDREDAGESVNDTYLAAWNSMPPHRPGVLATYLGKLTRRISIDLFRKKNIFRRRIVNIFTEKIPLKKHLKFILSGVIITLISLTGIVTENNEKMAT